MVNAQDQMDYWRGRAIREARTEIEALQQAAQAAITWREQAEPLLGRVESLLLASEGNVLVRTLVVDAGEVQSLVRDIRTLLDAS